MCKSDAARVRVCLCAGSIYARVCVVMCLSASLAVYECVHICITAQIHSLRSNTPDPTKQAKWREIIQRQNQFMCETIPRLISVPKPVIPLLTLSKVQSIVIMSVSRLEIMSLHLDLQLESSFQS